MNPIHSPSSVPSQDTISSSSSSSLPPEAIALAGRLFEAARKGDGQSEMLIRVAVERGGERLANLTNDKGDSLIMLSAYHGHAAIVRLLLSHGADPNRLNDRGQSPLAGVVFKNERECILALLEGGADPEMGEPSAIGACEVFRQEEYLGMFREQVRRLRSGGAVLTNGVSHVDGEDSQSQRNGDSISEEQSTMNGHS